MALPGSGTITWEMIRAQFGGGYPIYMSQYYRGGGLVPNIGANANVPTSGSISAWHFYNATNYTPLVASASPPELMGSRLGTGTGSISRSTSISASGGTPGYTYATTWSSGGSGLSITNGTTATPGVTGSAAPYTRRTGTLRVRVTDAAAAYYDVYVNVDFIWES